MSEQVDGGVGGPLEGKVFQRKPVKVITDDSRMAMVVVEIVEDEPKQQRIRKFIPRRELHAEYLPLEAGDPVQPPGLKPA